MATVETEVFAPEALSHGLLVGRVWQVGVHAGPTIALFDGDGVFDLSSLAATMSELLERPDLQKLRRSLVRRRPLCSISEIVDRSRQASMSEIVDGPYLLAPCDLQVIKACGVTFAVSALERVVEERTGGHPELATEARRGIEESLGTGLTCIKPGSPAAVQLKERLLKLNMWSQYLEVAFGPDAEVFTKASPLSAVGYGAQIGILRASAWNNPEPEVVLAVNSRGEVVGATLGNDVNLRDIEGRSALLLGKAKDNNGACAIGPAIRLFDDTFTLDDVRRAEISLRIDGADGFQLNGSSSMGQISRDPTELVRQTMGLHHQYPDGLMLFLGTLFAPSQDRDKAGFGFTHRVGDRVTIRTPALGALVNHVNYCDAIPPWTFGIGELFGHLQRRAVL
jgi:fumarylacetoacetate (FAA) hydrolase family protein